LPYWSRERTYSGRTNCPHEKEKKRKTPKNRPKKARKSKKKRGPLGITADPKKREHSTVPRISRLKKRGWLKRREQTATLGRPELGFKQTDRSAGGAGRGGTGRQKKGRGLGRYSRMFYNLLKGQNEQTRGGKNNQESK